MCNIQTGSLKDLQLWKALKNWLLTQKVADPQQMHPQEPAKHQPDSDSQRNIQYGES